VEDNGRGIEAQSLEHVFEPFFTRKRPTAGARAGTGLGLSVCQAIVDAHGGRIFAESGGAGWGSRFTVLIPVVPPVAVHKVEVTNA
jgi:signal transduction histidine kinase